MNLKRLEINNIRSYKHEETSFPSGSILLSGDIGSGKTTILLAIEFALFGLQPGQRGSSLLSNGENEGGVVLELEVDGKEVIIERTLRRGNKSINQETSSITIEGVKEDLSVTELKSRVLDLLNYPPEFIKKNNLLYRYTVYSPQEEMKQIILEDPETRLNVLRHIFGIEKYKKIRENLQILTARLREQAKIIQAEIKPLEENKISLASQKEFANLLVNKISNRENVLKDKIFSRKSLEKERDELSKNIEQKQKFEKEIEKTTIMVAYKNKEYATMGKEILDLEKKISQDPVFDQKEFAKVIHSLSEARARIEALNKAYIEVSSSLQSLEAKKKLDLGKKERIFNIQMCPTCLQDVSETHKHNILNETENELASINKEISKLIDRKKELDSVLVSEKKSLSEFEELQRHLELIRASSLSRETAITRIKELTKARDDVKSDTELLEKHIVLLKQSSLEFSKYENLFRLKEGELKAAFQAEKNSEIELAELRKELELIRKESNKLEEEISKKQLSKVKLNRLLETEKWLSTEFSNLVAFTERNIMLKLRRDFSRFFNHWFGMLTPDSFFVHLDETFTPIVTQGDFELDYAFLSGGERTAIALAYRLALNQIINSLYSTIRTKNIIILDEPTDGFSSQQLDKVRDILQELNIDQLIIVSHEQKIESFVDTVIRVKKDGGISSVAPTVPN